WLKVYKPIIVGDALPQGNFEGILITSPQAWLKAQLNSTNTSNRDFPNDIPTIIDGVDDLEDWIREQLTVSIEPYDWEQLMLACPSFAEEIRVHRVQLTHEIFQHPENPYECYLISEPEEEILCRLFSSLDLNSLPQAWKKFWQLFKDRHETFSNAKSSPSPPLLWATTHRRQGSFTLHCAPIELSQILSPIWQRQPVVLIGSALEPDTEATLFRQRLGLGDFTCLKFSSDYQTQAIQLYIPNKLPLPNTPEFKPVFIHQVRTLVCLSATSPGLTVILVGDVPLKSQLGAILASEFGSRVRVDKTCLDENGILVCGWEFWRENQRVLPSPQMLIISTLPLLKTYP
ncbi:MAG: ATP-dependent DNA helicase, partial [Rivularia sp. ALOHA_DT_140]|nr:ATP-dependent DNA helicase [Rivularia sp. ALOHA_DT_140]